MDSMGPIFGGGGGGQSPTGGTNYPTSPSDVPGISGGWFNPSKIGSQITPVGGSTEYDPGPEGGGVPGTILPGPTGGTGGGANIGKILGTLGTGAGGIMGLVNSFRDSPTEKLMGKQQKLAQQNIQAASSAGNQQLSQYMQGQLSAPQQASVDKFKKEQLAKWRQYLASAGIPESSAMADIEAKVDQDATDYAQKLLQQNFQNSVSALGLSNNALAQQAAANLAYEKEIAKSQADAMSAIGQLGGLLGQLG